MGDPTEEVAISRRFRGWTTDAVYMGNVRKVAIATDCRDLHFFSISATSVFEDVQLFGKMITHMVPNTVQTRSGTLHMSTDKQNFLLHWFKGFVASPQLFVIGTMFR